MIETAPVKETAVLVGIINKDQDEKLVAEYLEELAFLADTAGAVVMKKFTQKLEFANPRTFVGEGKLAEIVGFVKENEIGFVVFDDELTPSQLRNLERELGCKILDRTNLILDIFAKRAQTSHAKTQVELAQLQYLLPRLVGMWTHLERQRGGIGLRGPGETEIETDRRVIRERIAWLKEKLKKIDKQMATQRKNREKVVRVSLVGYTNVGKSTVMNLLSKSNVFAENKLFATLETTVRKVVVENLPFLLSDTVGFIRKLPHHLIESFKSTLDEVREADILLHIVDISHPSFEKQINTVNETLKDLNVAEKPIFIIFNKIDQYEFIPKETDDLSPITKENWTIEDLQKSWMAKSNSPCLFISATQKTNLDLLRETLYLKVKEIHVKRYPYDNFFFN
jgi:GTP-binding protein HflX